MASYFKNLNYTMGDEDASPEMHFLPNGSKHVMAVADCGSRIIPLLAKYPERLTCVDINSEQLAVCEMRIALLRHCDLKNYRRFLGYENSMCSLQRKKIFSQLDISMERKSLLEEMFNNIEWGAMLYYGKFEKMLKTLSNLIRLTVGVGAIGIFSTRNMDEQISYYRKQFPHRRWAIALALLANSTALNSLLYKGDYPKKNIPGTYFSIYKNIFHRLFMEQPVKESFFLQMILLGRIVYPEGDLIECSPKVFSQAQQGVRHCKVDFVHRDIFDSVSNAKNVDFVSMSDVPSFIHLTSHHEYLERIKPGLAQGALVAVRSHVRVIRPNTDGFRDVSARYLELTKNEATRLWSFHLYQRQ
ncbi:DUF3419 family protein [Glaciimonas sp. PAMC28666]|uniref:DUF3419 family protein n=1 Tax=Glaciimonas sp. PAMC28666 TaxID=2807626 RepID=UPI00196517F0|nr:DUF3419 family protein [Glaciimonas sp. PAMC28666]QRX84056.1 DUF3419 family protein [Glaciimonas sp. PAMC28666]